MKPLVLTSLAAILAAAGCTSYSARFELQSSKTEATRADALAVKDALSDLLATVGFSPVSEETLKTQRRYDADLIALWGKTNDFGFLRGEKNTTVRLYTEGDVIVLVVNSKDDGDKEEVSRTRDALQQMLGHKFPQLRIRLQSWSYFNLA